MKNIFVLGIVSSLLLGCATSKIKVPRQATQIAPYNSVVATFKDCMHVGHFKMPEQHPNNYQRYILKNTYNAGGTHYEVTEYDTDWKDRPISGEFNAYFCREKPKMESSVERQVTQQAPAQAQLPYVINIQNK